MLKIVHLGKHSSDDQILKSTDFHLNESCFIVLRIMLDINTFG